MIASADPAMSNVIQVQQLSRNFGGKQALQDVNLSVPRGTVFGLVGANGAGKTTLLKHVLGLLRAESGSVRVFGLDPVAQPAVVLSRIGYLSEDNDLPGWMSVRELMFYTRSFYPNWDDNYAEQLRQSFGLDSSAKLKKLSRGQRARAGLLAALAYRPELLVLDEPSSGLDPIVRRDILGAIIRTIADEGRTVIFSSHLLDEVERVSDHVAMINGGKMVLCDALDDLKANHRRVILRFAEPRTEAPSMHGALTWEGRGHDWAAIYRGSKGRLASDATRAGAELIEDRGISLDEIFVASVAAANVRTSEG